MLSNIGKREGKNTLVVFLKKILLQIALKEAHTLQYKITQDLE